jgi:glutamate carboxypeptidase
MMKQHICICSLLLLLPSPRTNAQSPAPASTLAAQERAIVEAVEARNGEALALLERVVNINSGTQNLAGVRAVGQVFRAELDGLGFTTEWADGAAWHRAGHLVAKHPGTGRKFLLIGHLDTVFEPDSPFQKFQRIDAATAKGPGIIDMKGGDVIIVAALKALKAAGVLAGMDITIVMTGDEEAPGDPQSRAREALVAAARGRDVAIGFEDGPGDPNFAVTARRGTSGWVLRVKGTAAHSSQIFSPEFGAGAVFEAARILNAFREKMAGEAHLTFNPGAMLGGTSVDFDPQKSGGTAFGKTNVIAEQAVVAGDLRTLSKVQLDKAKQTMQEIATAAMPRTQATLTFDEGYPSLAPTDGNAQLLAVYDRASRDLGYGPVAAVNPDKAGAADVSFVAGEVKMIMDGVGLMGHDDHTPGETADLSTLPSQTKRAAITLYRLFHSRTGV